MPERTSTQASCAEQGELEQLGIDPTRLLLTKPDWLFRHTLTKPDYERFADIRLKSCFTILDMKRQLQQSDRATLIGAANYILLIRKGSKEQPALPEEMQSLHDNYNFIAKMPVIIADHRLDIDIIAPKTDLTLVGDKYDVLDSRLLNRLLGTLSISGHGQRNETQVTLSGAVARVMENRRHMMARTLEVQIAVIVKDSSELGRPSPLEPRGYGGHHDRPWNPALPLTEREAWVADGSRMPSDAPKTIVCSSFSRPPRSVAAVADAGTTQ